MQSGKPSSSALSPALTPTVPLVSSVSVNPALAFNSSVPINVAGHDFVLLSYNAVNPPVSLNHASPMNVANDVPLSSPSCTPHVDEDGFRPMKKAFQCRVRPNNQQGSHTDQQSNPPTEPSSTKLPEGEGGPSKTPDQPPDSVLPGSEGIIFGVPAEGEDGVGKASALIDVATSNMVSNSVIHNSSLTLSNGFNVLNLEHALSEMVDPWNIALGADPIGVDD
ncbi:unnamed protein product [Amaranthus hypochondriacus]